MSIRLHKARVPKKVHQSIPWKRKLKGRKRVIPDECRARILKSVVRGQDHDYLDPEDYAIPTADNGARRVVFESTYGPVSPTSEVYRLCGDPNCVRPSHCEVENAEMREARLSGAIERRIIVSSRKVMTVSQYEKELRVPGTAEAWARELVEGPREDPR